MLTLHLEKQIELCELDFEQERKRLVEMQSLKRLRDDLEKRSML